MAAMALRISFLLGFACGRRTRPTLELTGSGFVVARLSFTSYAAVCSSHPSAHDCGGLREPGVVCLAPLGSEGQVGRVHLCAHDCGRSPLSAARGSFLTTTGAGFRPAQLHCVGCSGCVRGKAHDCGHVGCGAGRPGVRLGGINAGHSGPGEGERRSGGAASRLCYSCEPSCGPFRKPNHEDNTGARFRFPEHKCVPVQGALS